MKKNFSSVMALIYHDKHQVVSCVCGILISGEHDCKITLSRVKVEVCYWFSGRSGEPCKICIVQEKLEKYRYQWTEDDSGYCICRECGDKTEAFLPKECGCSAFVDKDGETKCKNCKEVWNCNLELTYACEKCGYENWFYCDC